MSGASGVYSFIDVVATQARPEEIGPKPPVL